MLTSIFVLDNSVDLDEMSLSVLFHLDLHSLQNTTLCVSSLQMTELDKGLLAEISPSFHLQ